MWKDLSKNSIDYEDWLVYSSNVIEEVFDTITNTSRGDIFYARNLDASLEQLLFSLEDENLAMKCWRILNRYKMLDGRLNFNINNTTVTVNENDRRQVDINTETLSGVSLNTRLIEGQ